MKHVLFFASLSLLLTSCQEASAGKKDQPSEPIFQAQAIETDKTIDPIVEVPSVQDQVKIEDWATGLKEPWGIHFIADNTALVLSLIHI